METISASHVRLHLIVVLFGTVTFNGQQATALDSVSLQNRSLYQTRNVQSDDNTGRWFESYSGNPLTIPTYQAKGVVHPDVILFPEGEDGFRYWLFYTPYPTRLQENPCLVRSMGSISPTQASPIL
jgi:hypothetical protein